MKIRSVLLLVVASCWLLAAGAPARTFRPAEAGPLDAPAGTVLLVQGKARVLAAGRDFEAAPGFSLGRGDELAVDLGGLAVIELANGYLVRIDEEISLQVAEILLLDAAPPRESLEGQLQRLFAGEERTRLPERIVGFHARVAAAESVGPQTSAQRSALTSSSAARSRKADSFSPPPAPPPPPAAAAAPARRPAAPAEFEADRAPAKEEAAAAPVGGMRAKAVARDELVTDAELAPSAAKRRGAAGPARQWNWTLRRAGALESAGDRPLPEPLLSALEGRVLTHCLAAAVRGLESPPARLELMVQVRDGRISKAALGRGLPMPPSCAAMLNGKPVELEGSDAPAWLTVEVPLR